MIADPARRGGVLAAFLLAVTPRLYEQLVESDGLPPAASGPAGAAAYHEWCCVALDAGLRGLVGASGFGPDTAAAVDALHLEVLRAWRAECGSDEAFDARRALAATRYQEYGAIARAADDDTVAALGIGAAAADHLAGPGAPTTLAERLATLVETLAEGAAQAVRIAEGEE